MHKILLSIIIITLRNFQSEEKLFNLIKDNYEKSRAKVILNSEILNHVLINSRAK